MTKEEILKLDRNGLYDRYLTDVILDSGSVLELVEELRQTTRYESDFVFRIYIEFSKILVNFTSNEREIVIKNATSMIEMATTMEVWEIVSYCHYMIATCNFNLGLYESCYEHANKALLIEEKFSMNKIKSQALRVKAMVHMRFDDEENGAAILKLALEALEETKDTDPKYAVRKPSFIWLYFPILNKLKRLDEMIPIMEEMEREHENDPTGSRDYEYNLARLYYSFTAKDYAAARSYYDKLIALVGDSDSRRFDIILLYCVASVIDEIDESFYYDVLMEGFELCKKNDFLQATYFYDVVVTVAQNTHRDELYRECLPLFTESLKKRVIDDTKARIHSFEVLESNLYRVNDYEEVESKNIELKRVAEEAIRHKNEVEEMNKRIQFVHELGRKLTTSLDIKEVVDLIYKNLKENVPLTTFFIVLADKKNHLLRSLTYYEWDELRPNFVIPMDSENSIIARCYREGKPIIIEDLSHDKSYTSQLLLKIGKDATESAIFMPLMVGDEVVAVCSLQHHTPNAYDAIHRSFLEELIPYLAIAVNNANKSTELENEINSHKKTHEHLMSANARLEMLSAIDGLTQISNRRDFETRVLSMLEESVRREKPITILMFDLDYFKTFNDTYGHLEGDEALKSVARIIRRRLDEVKGLSARFGGEEFVAACLGLNEEESIRLANNIREDLYRQNIRHEKSPIGRLTISIGIAISTDNTEVSKSDIMRWADISLYKAKNTGKNKAVVKMVVAGEEIPSGVASQIL